MSGAKRVNREAQELRIALARIILGMPARNMQHPELMASVTKALELLVPGSKWQDVTTDQLILISKGKA